MKYANIRGAIEQLRNEEKITVEQMADQAGISFSELIDILTGKTQQVTDDIIPKIADSFNRTIIENGDLIAFENPTIVIKHMNHPKMHEICKLLQQMPESRLEEIAKFLHKLSSDETKKRNSKHINNDVQK